MTFTLSGQIPSGKNQVKTAVVKGRVIHFPNKVFKAWREAMLPQLAVQAKKYIETGAVLPVSSTISLECEYTPGDARTRDVSGMLDALFHLIVRAGLLVDDGLVWAVTWRRNEMDRQKPGLRFTIS